MEVFDTDLQKGMEQKVRARNAAAAEALLATYAMVDTWFEKCVTHQAPDVLTRREVTVLYGGLGTLDIDAIYEWLQGRLSVLQIEQPDLFQPKMRVVYLKPQHGYDDTPVFAVLS